MTPSAASESAMQQLLRDQETRPLTLDSAEGLKAEGLLLGPGNGGLEIAVLSAAAAPRADLLKRLWKSRRAGRATPVLLAVFHGLRATLCGPDGEEPPVHRDVEADRTRRICVAALAEPDRHAALRFLRFALPTVADTGIPGLRNEGLFASHELLSGPASWTDWPASQEKASSILSLRSRPLLNALGLQVADSGQHFSILRRGETKVAVAIFLDRKESVDAASQKYNGQTPIQYSLRKADEENLDYVFVDHGPSLRLYTTAAAKGVGRRGRTETFVEVHLDLLSKDRAGYLWLLFSGEALSKGGSFSRILDRSHDYAVSLGEKLRDRIYEHVVPALSVALARARKLRKPGIEDLRRTYEMALLVLFRLLFVAYAEDKDLLPYRSNELYRTHSLKWKARMLAELRRKNEEKFGAGAVLWREVSDLFRAVDKGKREWGVPAYDGGLFDASGRVGEAGKLLEGVELEDADFGPVLSYLLVEENQEGFGPVDFRSLGVREFGTIYEGLLESELSLAEEDLALDKDDNYVPAGRKSPVVRKGEIYLHNRGGARKSTGTYFTKSFAVDYLLDRALEPALDDHLKRLEALKDDRAKAESFFDFRVADIAMGSGHFLVAAVDRIEVRFSNYLSDHRLSGVLEELQALRANARRQVAEVGGTLDDDAVEDVQLLRRQIARRCTFGVDVNPTAVMLARLSLWIHTFVPGLPLSVLDHNIVEGNALLGIGTLEEVEKEWGSETHGIFTGQIRTMLEPAKEALSRLKKLSDADAKQVQQAMLEYLAVKSKLSTAREWFDLCTAARIPGFGTSIAVVDYRDFSDPAKLKKKEKLTKEADKRLQGVRPLHFPEAFPEVFLRERPGFDVILGNPPWEKVRVEEHEFWARHFPGLRAKSGAELRTEIERLRRTRSDLQRSLEIESATAEAVRDLLRHLPGMNTGHPDLFRGFVARYRALLTKQSGRLGVVLPGDAFKIKGARPFREQLASEFLRIEIQFLTNTANWLFDDVEARKLIAFLVGTSSSGSKASYEIWPEVHRMDDWKRNDRVAATLSNDWVASYSAGFVLPTLTRTDSVAVLDTFMRSPKLGEHPHLSVRRVYADFETTKHPAVKYHAAKSANRWPVYKGESFDLWTSDTGTHFAYADEREVLTALQAKRLRGGKDSSYAKCAREWREDPKTLPQLAPRICFRETTNRTNTRTFLVARIPARVITTQTAPWILWLDAGHPTQQEDFLLGVLSTRIFDWWMRRFVEVHVDEEAFLSMRVPRWSESDRFAARVVAISRQIERESPSKSAAELERNQHELEAVVALLYGLPEPQVRHVFETFHEGWEYRPHLEAVLTYFRKWNSNAP